MFQAFNILNKLFQGCTIMFLLHNSSHAQDSNKVYKLYLDIPAIDIPFGIKAANTGHYFDSYSMQQSLAITQNFHNANYYLTNKLWHKFINPDSQKKKMLNRLVANITSGTIDYIFTYYGVVLSPQWLHEEFHRNGMTIRGISSYNETYNRFNGGYANGSISRVTDEDMIRFKKEAPQEMIRSFASGIESEYLLLRNMQKDNFFRKTMYPNLLMNILLTNHAIGYVNQFKRKDYDYSIDLMNEYGTEISERDFVGWDFTPWVYDLHRPNEPYEARGIHPSGNGIDRAIKTTKLSREEYKYLEKMGKRQYLNFITPFMIGISRFSISSHTSFNFAVRHYLSSFGDDITVDFFLDHKNKQYLFALHKYSNKDKCFPGVEAEFPAFDFPWQKRKLSLSPAAMVWLQPDNFYSKSPYIGGSFRAKANISVSKWLDIYTVLEGKSKGWVAGNPYLGNNLGIRTGIYVTLY